MAWEGNLGEEEAESEAEEGGRRRPQSAIEREEREQIWEVVCLIFLGVGGGGGERGQNNSKVCLSSFVSKKLRPGKYGKIVYRYNAKKYLFFFFCLKI